MATRLTPLLFPPIRFVQPGSAGHADPFSPSTLRAALATGGSGLAVAVYSTAQGTVVASERATVGRFLRRKPISLLTVADLADSVTPLSELRRIVHGGDLLLRIGEEQISDLDRALSEPGSERSASADSIWLSHPDLDVLETSRESHWPGRLVHSTRLSRLERGPERHGAELAAAGVDALEMHHTDWTGGLTTLFHRFGIACIAAEAVHERECDGLFDMGIDGVISTHASTMERSFTTFYGESPPLLPRPTPGSGRQPGDTPDAT